LRPLKDAWRAARRDTEPAQQHQLLNAANSETWPAAASLKRARSGNA